MSQLDIPFKYEDTPKKELTPEELIYISEIKQGNFKHVCFLPHTQDELTELLCQDTGVEPNLRKKVRSTYWRNLLEEGNFEKLKEVFRATPKMLETLHERYEEIQEEKQKEKQKEQEQQEQEQIKQKQIEAQAQREKRLNIHIPLKEVICYEERISDHILACKGYKRQFGTFEKLSRDSLPSKEINKIAHQLLLSKISPEEILNTLRKLAHEIVTRRGEIGGRISNKELSVVILLLPEAEEVKKIILNEMLNIIATLPITTLEHRKKISMHNNEIRDKLKKHFQQQEDKNELKKKNLFPFYKYNNHHFYKCGGKHFNDKLPNGEIEYLTACIEKQKKLLGNFIDCLVLAYEFTKVESRNEMLEILAYEFTTVEGRNETLEVKEITLKTFPKCKFVYNTIRPEHLKEISDYRRYYIL